jgi:molybdate transport system substrate-binding protein
MRLKLLSGGAAQGLVQALAPRFKAETGVDIDGSFGAVGAMRDKLVGGEPADLVILTAVLIGELGRDGHVVAGSTADLGAVPTCIAVRTGDAVPPVGNGDELRAALRLAGGIYFPDPKLATAGIHFAKVLDALGIREELGPRLRPHPNGATAMRALATSTERRPIGCTQATEILNTPGTVLVGPLPPGHALAAVYTVGLCVRAAAPGPAKQFAALLTHPDNAELRQRLGFAAPDEGVGLGIPLSLTT